MIGTQSAKLWAGTALKVGSHLSPANAYVLNSKDDTGCPLQTFCSDLPEQKISLASSGHVHFSKNSLLHLTGCIVHILGATWEPRVCLQGVAHPTHTPDF